MLKKVLFVCVENACRSQMSEAFFNKFALGKAVAISAGTKPSSQVDPKAIHVMNEIGINMSKQKPKLLTSEMMKGVDKIVTMGCGANVCPAPYVKAEEWNIQDPSGKSLDKYREVRDIIKRKVEELVKKLVTSLG